jgi:hypothetical protein
VKSRLTSWLAALLLITAVFGLPVTRVATNRTVCYQVYCEQRKEECAEQIETPPAVVHQEIRAAALPDRFPLRLLDHSLFQRPPPSSSL